MLFIFHSDVNECKDKPCGANAICTDTIGSHTCTCKEDFTGDPYKGCVGMYTSDL